MDSNCVVPTIANFRCIKCHCYPLCVCGFALCLYERKGYGFPQNFSHLTLISLEV